jgi:hypothetical protein
MSFFATAAGYLGKLAMSLGTKSLGDKVKEIKTQRRMQRLVDDAVDRIVEQTEEYLRTENVNEHRKEILIASLCSKLQPLAEDPQRFFIGDLNGEVIFKHCHPDGKLPEEIREEQLGQFYTVLFPQIAHFLAGSRIALAEWQAEGFREEFKRLSQLAEEIRAMNAKVADLPNAVTRVLTNQEERESEVLLREFSQTLLNSLLLRLDLSPLRAERALHGSLTDHFVVPAVQESGMLPHLMVGGQNILEVITAPAARRVLHGSAGVGKTTCSLWLQSRLLLADPSRLAIVFRLREITDIENHSLLDLLRARAGAHLKDALTDKILRGWHEAGRVVVIFDGFDEVPEQRRNAVERWLRDLAVIAKKTAIVITSRPLQSGHLENLQIPWQQWTLLPFDEPRIVEFIRRWHRYLPEGELSAAERKVDAEALAHTFFSDPSLKPLADTPLMLGTLLFVHHRDKKLPSGRVDLYERYIAAMLGLRDSGLGIEARATKLTDKEKRRVLAHIALHFHLNGINEASDRQMRGLAKEALAKFRFDEKVDRLLPALCERTGLLQGPGAWSFMHKTIGEFLVAELICDGTIRLPDQRRLDRKELWENRHRDSWTAVLFFWAGRTSPRELEEFIEDLIQDEYVDGALLALAMLNDQGDRLAYNTQREFAKRILSKPWGTRTGMAVSSTGVVPTFAFVEYKSEDHQLKGLTRVSSVQALMNFFSRKIFKPSDLPSFKNQHVPELTVASLWALDEPNGALDFGYAPHLIHLPERDVSLYYFDAITRANSFLSIESSVALLTVWEEAFPFGISYVPLLLIGASYDYLYEGKSLMKAVIGVLLWERRNLSLPDDWLRGSKEWMKWGEDMGDLLVSFREMIIQDGAIPWGLSAAQHLELVEWCNNTVQRRDQLQ